MQLATERDTGVRWSSSGLSLCREEREVADGDELYPSWRAAAEKQ
jgi:hypothetical protein